MKITVFTSDKSRHNYLINYFSKISNELFVIQEFNENKTKIDSINSFSSNILKKYFKKVEEAQIKIFGNNINLPKKLKLLTIPSGDLNTYSLSFLSEFLNSDFYVVFGSSYIKGELIEFLAKKKAINIHMGILPFYRGADCNFWALYDNNPHLVGATIHILSKGLDTGPILYHAMSNIKTDPFLYTMSTVKSAIHSIAEKIENESIYKITPFKQNKLKELRYSLKSDFTKEIVKKYFDKNINLNSKKFDNLILKEPFFLD